MKKIVFLILLLSVLIFACTKNEETQLSVKNNTNGKVWVKVNSSSKVSIPSKTSKLFSWVLKSGGIGGDEVKNIKIEYNGYTVFSADTTITLSAGDFKTFDINADGGCIKIINNSEYFNIVEVYISPIDSLYWGDDVLNGTIAPQDSVSWTCSPDIWDIKIVDDFGDSFTAMEQRIELDQIYRYEYTGFKKAKITSMKKPGSLKINTIQKN